MQMALYKFTIIIIIIIIIIFLKSHWEVIDIEIS